MTHVTYSRTGLLSQYRAMHYNASRSRKEVSSAVIKVRGTWGNVVHGSLKIAGERSQAHTANNGTSRLRGAPSDCSRAPSFFQSSWLPNLYFNHWEVS